MDLNLSVDGAPSRKMFVSGGGPVRVGEVVTVVDKLNRGKPFSARVVDVKVHTGGGEIYYVEAVKP